MKISSAAAHTLVPPKVKEDKPLNPAQQARAENPEAKGRVFGQLVSSIARAKHAPPPAPSETPPAIQTPPPVEETPPEPADVAPPTGDAPPPELVALTPPPVELPPGSLVDELV